MLKNTAEQILQAWKSSKWLQEEQGEQLDKAALRCNPECKTNIYEHLL